MTEERGIYYCPQRGCRTRGVERELPLRLWSRGETPPRCSCGSPRRLLRVVRHMPEKVKRALRERAEQRRVPA